MAVPTLRAWESRHGFPTPHQPSGAHRRYSHDDVDAIHRVVEARRAGYSLEAAIAHATAVSRPRSIFAAVSERWPGLQAQTVSRRTMLAISRAIEDECCARAATPLLVAAFQTTTAYAAARARWRELARTASAAVVLAAFDRSTRRRDAPTEIAIDPKSPVLREWAVICDAPGSSACLIGWEHPDRGHRPRRAFEAIWSIDSAVVRTATRAALALADEHAAPRRLPAAGPPLIHQTEPVDADRLVRLADRIVANLDRALERCQ